MSALQQIADLFINLDVHLGNVIGAYGAWTYSLLFLIIFCETGLVVTPFLPGDSLLFAAGAFAAHGSLEVPFLFLLLSIAAIVGDTVNYAAGACLGPKVFGMQFPFLRQKHLLRTQRFYEAYGGKTIVIARFIPIIRTFAPFVAGIGSMQYPRFLSYNVFGGFLWVCTFVFGGYFFGNIPFVQQHFEWVILGIIVASILPAVRKWWR